MTDVNVGKSNLKNVRLLHKEIYRLDRITQLIFFSILNQTYAVGI